jgi:predicted TIM-barrel fold metal-dependent hydrolase
MTVALADAHLHLFSRGFPGSRGRQVLGRDSEVEAYEAFRAAYDIRAGLIVGYEGQGIDPDNNSYIRALAAGRPWMATLAYGDPSQPLTAEMVTRWMAEGHVGIALYLPDAAASAGASAWPASAWRTLEEHHAIISLNAPPQRIDSFAPTVGAYAGCRFVFSHLGLPGRHPTPPTPVEAADRLKPLLRLAARPNTLVKISGLYAVSDPAHDYPHASAAPFIDLILDGFGPGRCLWGSDFSPALEFVSFAQTASVRWLGRLTPAERAGVMGGNLLRLLGRKAHTSEGEDA